jgi:hypothetical protein
LQLQSPEPLLLAGFEPATLGSEDPGREGPPPGEQHCFRGDKHFRARSARGAAPRLQKRWNMQKFARKGKCRRSTPRPRPLLHGRGYRVIPGMTLYCQTSNLRPSEHWSQLQRGASMMHACIIEICIPVIPVIQASSPRRPGFKPRRRSNLLLKWIHASSSNRSLSMQEYILL